MTTECDQAVQGLLKDYHSGGLPVTEGEVRALVAGHIVRAGIADEVAREAVASANAQDVEDLAEDLEKLMVDKVMQGAPGGYDLERGLEASATGWARQLLRTARRSAARNIKARGVSKQIPVDPTGTYIAGVQPRAHVVFHTAATAPVQLHSAEPDRDAVEDAETWFSSRSRHLRDASRLASQAAAIRHAYGLPVLVRHRMLERARLRALVAADRSLAVASLKAMRALVAGEQPVIDHIDNGLMALWDEFSYDAMEVVADAPARVAEALVDAALADRPRPSRDTLAAFRNRLRAAGHGPGWKRTAERLADAYVALEFEASSAFDSAAAEFQDQRAAGRAILCHRAPEAFAAVIACPTQTLGFNEDAVYESLNAIAAELTDPVIAPEALAA